METRCCKVLFPGYFKKAFGGKILLYRRYGKNGQDSIYCSFVFFVHAAARGAICVFTLKLVNTLIKNKLTRRYTFDLDIQSTHRQPALCRARLKNVDDDLQDIRWIPDLGGKEAARGVLRSSPSPDKRSFLAIG